MDFALLFMENTTVQSNVFFCYFPFLKIIKSPSKDKIRTRLMKTTNI